MFRVQRDSIVYSYWREVLFFHGLWSELTEMWGIAGLEKTAPVCQTVRDKLVILKNLLLDFLGSTVEASPGKNWIKDLLFHLNHSVELSKSYSFKYEALIPYNNKGLFLTHDMLSVAVFHILCHTQDISWRNIAFGGGALPFLWQGKEKWQNQLLGSDLLLFKNILLDKASQMNEPEIR